MSATSVSQSTDFQPLEAPGASRVAKRIHRIGSKGLVATLAGMVVVAAAAWWVTNSPLFDMRTLRVSGTHHLTPATVAAIGRLDARTNVLWLSSAAVARRLTADPWIESVRVSRVLPTTIKVFVQERVPVAVVFGQSLLVAGDGTVLGVATGRSNLPLIDAPPSQLVVGARLASGLPALIVARTLPRDLRGLVLRVSMDPATGLTLLLRDGAQVLYGDPADAVSKAASLEAVLAWSESHNVQPATIDVRAPDVPALRPSGPVPSIVPTQ